MPRKEWWLVDLGVILLMMLGMPQRGAMSSLYMLRTHVHALVKKMPSCVRGRIGCDDLVELENIGVAGETVWRRPRAGRVG